MKKILIVDDHVGILEMVQFVLVSEGYAVRTSVDSACIQHMHGDMPDLIILDVLLADEDGCEICRCLKGNEQTRHIPVMLLSAHSNVSKAIEECSANAFLAKPFRVNELKTMVRELLFSPHTTPVSN